MDAFLLFIFGEVVQNFANASNVDRRKEGKKEKCGFISNMPQNKLLFLCIVFIYEGFSCPHLSRSQSNINQ
jgi:hypothetical protein